MPMLHENSSIKRRLKLKYIECAFGIRVRKGLVVSITTGLFLFNLLQKK